MICSTSGRHRVLSRALVGISLVLLVGFLLADQDEETLSMRDPHFDKQRIAGLVAELSDPKGESRLQAINQLADLGPEAQVAIPKLIDLLEDNTTIVGQYVQVDTISVKAAVCLTAIGGEIVLPLVRRFPDQSPAVQGRVIFLAGLMGLKARGLLPVFLEAFKNTKKDGDANYRSELISAIAAIDPTGKAALPLLVEGIQREKSEWVRRAAAQMLNRSEYLEQVYWRERSPAADWFRESTVDSKPAVDALLAALSDPSKEVRAAAAFSISTYPEAAKRAIPKLIRMLDDPEFFSVAYSNHVVDSEPVGDAAATALSRMHADADVVLPLLIKYVSDSRTRRADLVADLALHSKHPLEPLTKLLRSEHPEVGLLGLARLGATARLAVPQVKAVTSPKDLFIVDKVKLTLACIDPEGQPNAVQAVERMLGVYPQETCDFLCAAGPSASFAVPFLKTRLQEKQIDGEFDYEVVRTLEAIGPESASAAQSMLDYIKEYGTYLQGQVEAALVRFGSGVAPALIDKLKDSAKSSSQCLVCVRVLGYLKIQDAEAVSQIAAQAGSQNSRIREAVAKALGAIASQPTQSLPVLQRLIADPRPLVRAAATESCGAFGEGAKSLVPALIGQLSDDYLDVRLATVSALGRIGPMARAALPKLGEMAKSDNVLIQETILKAQTAIDAK